MKTVAFIPARGGSKSIKNKNIMELGGKPLIWYVISACQSPMIDKIYVSTDSDGIKSIVEWMNFDNVEVISRSPDTATDSATSESALIEFCENYEFEKVVFLQATSPLTTRKDVEGALIKLKDKNAESLISVVNNYQFLWSKEGEPLNYNPSQRPRRQDWDGYYIENGAFYINKRENILRDKCRISSKPIFWEMSSKTIFEVDEPDDWKIIERFLHS